MKIKIKRVLLIALAVSLSLAVFVVSFAMANDSIIGTEPPIARQGDDSEFLSDDDPLNGPEPINGDGASAFMSADHKEVPYCVFDCANCPFAAL